MAAAKIVPAAVEPYDVLDRVNAGKQVSPGELATAAAAAAALRRDWLAEVAGAIAVAVPRTPEFEAFKDCLRAVGTLLVQYGIISAAEMNHVWLRIEEKER
jgi:hypothetical protein